MKIRVSMMFLILFLMTTTTHASNGYILLSMARQERILPAAVIKETLEEKVEAIDACVKDVAFLPKGGIQPALSR